jgi:hypothetical protein
MFVSFCHHLGMYLIHPGSTGHPVKHSENHRFTPHVRPLVSSRKTPGEPHRRKELGTDLEVWHAFFRWRARAGWSNVNDTRTKTIGRKDSPRYVFDQELPVWSKGIQESFRRGPRERAETPKNPLARRAHKVHPYFSDNLRYAY